MTDGTIIPSYEEVELDTIVNSIITMHQTLIESKEQRLDTQIPKDVICKTDIQMLTRALSNVVLNAIQNTPESGEICIWHEDSRLFILNKGATINSAALSNVFEPFYREDKARSSEVNRSGLGLTIVKKTLDCMGVKFSLESTNGGVCFWLELPSHIE